MKVHQFYLNNSLRNYNYILYSEITNQAIVFDPYDAGILVQELEKLGVVGKYLVNTHQHPDHISGNNGVLKSCAVTKLEPNHEEVIQLSETEKILARFTPGHVMDHYCFFLYENEKMTGVICGDTVFNGGIGNCKNGGDVDTLYKTIRDEFVGLPDDVVIYPSHDYFLSNLNFAKTLDPENIYIDKYIDLVEKQRAAGDYSLTTIGEEKLYNPFFRVFNPEFAKNFEMSEKELFIDIRKKRDKW